MQQAKAPRATVRTALVKAHRWLSLAFAAFWLLQAATGVLIVYHWEIDDAALSDIHRPTDFAAIERRIDALTPPGSGKRATSLWTSAGLPDRYDLDIAGPGDSSATIRIAGDGTVLRSRDGKTTGLPTTLVLIHHKLLAGEIGEWIVGISGMLLLSNLLLGLCVAWPRRGSWRRAVVPAGKAPAAAKNYSWHRAVGLWAIVPAILLVGAGTLLRFEASVSAAIGAEAPRLPPNPPVAGATQVSFARAADAALAALPGSRLTAVSWPSDEDATYRVRLLESSERRRAYGTGVVLIDAYTGRVRAAFPAARAPPARSFMNALFAFHTGEFGGAIGRVLVLALGLWLTTMIILGLQLWWRRRPKPNRGSPWPAPSPRQ